MVITDVHGEHLIEVQLVGESYLTPAESRCLLDEIQNSGFADFVAVRVKGGEWRSRQSPLAINKSVR